MSKLSMRTEHGHTFYMVKLLIQSIPSHNIKSNNVNMIGGHTVKTIMWNIRDISYSIPVPDIDNRETLIA